MKVLVACEYSGTVRDAFLAKGHDAISADLLDTESPGPHIKGDVLELLDEPFDLVIAHPPCTYLSNSGVRHLYNKDGSLNEERWLNMEDGARFFAKMLEFNSPRIAIENPIQHKYAKAEHGLGDQSQTVQPWWFGHPENKSTCLWLYGLPLLKKTNDVKQIVDQLSYAEANKIHYASPGPERWKLRSKTYQGLADAMASQWG